MSILEILKKSDQKRGTRRRYSQILYTETGQLLTNNSKNSGQFEVHCILVVFSLC
jgi:hypothetical protein